MKNYTKYFLFFLYIFVNLFFYVVAVENLKLSGIIFLLFFVFYIIMSYFINYLLFKIKNLAFISFIFPIIFLTIIIFPEVYNVTGLGALSYILIFSTINTIIYAYFSKKPSLNNLYH